jgi:hypothetical protein
MVLRWAVQKFAAPMLPASLKFLDEAETLKIALCFEETREIHLLDVETSSISVLCGSTSEKRLPRDILYMKSYHEYVVVFDGECFACD